MDLAISQATAIQEKLESLSGLSSPQLILEERELRILLGCPPAFVFTYTWSGSFWDQCGVGLVDASRLVRWGVEASDSARK